METELSRAMFSKRRVWLFLFSLLVSAGIFSYLFSTVSLHEVIELLQGLTLRWILLFLLLSFSMSLFRTWRYMIVLNASGYQPDPVALYLITLVRNFFSDLLPARLGTLIYIYLVQSRLGIQFGAAASSFAFAFIFDMFSLAFLIVLAVLVGSSDIVSPVVVICGGVLIAGVSMAVMFLLPGILQATGTVCRSIPLVPEKYRIKMHDVLNDTRRDIMTAKKQGIYWRIFSLSLGVRCFKYLSLYVLLLALVLPLGFEMVSFPLPKVFLGLCSAEMAASLPISGIAGFGAYEGAWTLVFQLLGYSQRIAALTSISHHLLTQVYGYSLGALALLVLLLPFFKKTAHAEYKLRTPARIFWPKFLAAGAILLSLSFFLFPEKGGSRSNPNHESRTPAGASASEKMSVDISNLRGKIVYQRPDGIYSLNIAESKTKQIVPYGTYPRWSPDGKLIAFVHNNAIMIVNDAGGGPKAIAHAEKARAVCFTPDGKAVLFTDGNYLKKVELHNHQVTILLKDNEFREVDISARGDRLAATVRTPFGIKVRVFELKSGLSRTVANGCSASLSPDGELVTVNGRKHKKLYLYDWGTLQVKGHVSSPPGIKFDNQYWSNNGQWLVSTSEGDYHDIFIHHVPSNTAYRLTTAGDCDRADLFVSGFTR